MKHKSRYFKELNNSSKNSLPILLKNTLLYYFDVRESPRFWWRLATAQDQMAKPEALKWLSTHPSHSDRAQKLETLLPKVKVVNNCRDV